MPLFVSRRTLAREFDLPEAKTRWALDSGGFSELSIYGRWTVQPAQYIREVRQFVSEIGLLDFAAAQDWMCEPIIREGGWMGKQRVPGTKLSVEEHQRRTVRNFLTLKEKAPDLPFIPVLQGWTREEYLRCLEMYDRAGVDLVKEERVGLGSVCRRQDTMEAEDLIRELAGLGVRVHAFGYSTLGLKRSYDHLASADSMAWSLAARYRPPLPGCEHPHCNNCRKFALQWRERVKQTIRQSRVLSPNPLGPRS